MVFIMVFQPSNGLGVSIVYVVPSRHCALPQPKTENDTIDMLHTCNARGAHTKIEISSEGISAIYTKICTHKNFLLYGIEKSILVHWYVNVAWCQIIAKRY